LPLLSASLFGNTPTSGPYTTSGIQVVKQGIEIYPSKYPQLRSYQTSIGVQRELPLGLMLTFDFARRVGTHAQLGELDLNRFGRTASGGSPVIPRCATAPDFDPTHNCSTGGITVWTPTGRTLYRGLLFKLQKKYSHHYQFQASYAFQDNQLEAPTVNLDNYMSTFGPNLARHNFNFAGVVDLPFGVKFSLNSSLISAAPASPVITGIDLNGSGNTTYPLTFTTSGLGYACFNVGCSKSDLVTAVDAFNSTLAGTKAKNGATIPKINLPASYQLGAPVINQDVRLTKEFSYKERYKAQVFGEFFNVLNIANLTYTNVTLNSAAFGQPTGRVGQASTFSSGGPRAIQVGARISF